MIRVYIPEIHASDLSGESRVGANVQVESDEYILCIDGRFGNAAKRVINRLNRRDKRKVLLLTHPHGDHYGGIEHDIDNYDAADALVCPDPNSYNKNYSAECKSNITALERIIKKAKAKNIKVIYAKNGASLSFGEIRFTVYRDQPSSARNTETYINQGSLCLWFPTIRFLYTGDTGAYCAKKYKLNPMFIGGLHHGNWLESEGRDYLKSVGCKYYWDDDYNTTMTTFLSTGRGNAKKAGMTIFNCHGDINLIAFKKQAVIYKGGKTYKYSCSYDGALSLKGANLKIVKAVLDGTTGSGDARITYLLDNVYNPGSVQGWVNTLYNLVKG